jgi:hypothetical protein
MSLNFRWVWKENKWNLFMYYWIKKERRNSLGLFWVHCYIIELMNSNADYYFLEGSLIILKIYIRDLTLTIIVMIILNIFNLFLLLYIL